jgi:hypothetical protein
MGYRYVVQKTHMNGASGHLREGTTDLSRAEFEKSLKDDGTLSGDYEVVVFEELPPPTGVAEVEPKTTGTKPKAGSKK